MPSDSNLLFLSAQCQAALAQISGALPPSGWACGADADESDRPFHFQTTHWGTGFRTLPACLAGWIGWRPVVNAGVWLGDFW